MIRRLKCFFFLGLVCLSIAGEAAEYYVSSIADMSGNGSMVNPWTLQAALSHPASLQPGDTVWIRAGVYTNTFDSQSSFSCFTNGEVDAPIIFRNFRSERVIIDGQQQYSLYVGLGNCSHTWFWGIEVTNSGNTDRNHDIPGGVTCTAENIKFINMIIHDTGAGIDAWKTAKNTEIYGCLVYHIGNNLNNNGNLEGHGHGLYLQNDTVGIKRIHNNILFSNYGNGLKIWQTTTTAAIGNFDVQHNIIFNGGSASQNLGGVGNNSRTHNMFVVANGVNNPIINSVIKHNYTYSGINMPRPPVNAIGLNYGVKNLVLDSNVLTCQTRLGYNNTPVFEASVKGNKIIGGIPPVYGVYLWGFTASDFPQNEFIPEIPNSGLDYYLLPNAYDRDRAHLAIYNWDSWSSVSIDISSLGLKDGDPYHLINVMDYFNDTISGIYPADGVIEVPMEGHSFAKPIGSDQEPASQFPKFGAFVIVGQSSEIFSGAPYHAPHVPPILFPNPATSLFTISNLEPNSVLEIYDLVGNQVWSGWCSEGNNSVELDLSTQPIGLYLVIIQSPGGMHQLKVFLK